ncbi:MAG: ferredoxin:thioredoxin reductase [Candidatus Scalindua sp. AMX11]|nr:MAG: ferredoxin:thioredoxin reductase [Candidatus Scalindua sp.]NOG84586.1 ferredoxin:thioredoxin reductase [Planctomycetota bacterium]RZV92361.1 MAG: ferredoxin:thioredoxin reductase [Candidatus Scalindua sp. SCAELEC01]TDE66114.1 MAG: ferredoxin:thioredoxin reductase [Candidatus Scalindua sp. AMX11]GJQ59088.1 MAG: ferredoxin:thioredoxin reductase [Candidatus Scalindua sp.]
MDNQLSQIETDIRKFIEEYVETGPYELNPNTKHVDKVIKGLAKRKLKHGQYYCPCRMLSENREIDDKIICPCEYHIEEIRQEGICSCDLFVRQDYQFVSPSQS